MTIQITKLVRDNKYLTPSQEEEIFDKVVKLLDENKVIASVKFLGRSKNIHAIARKNLRGDLIG